MALLDVLQGKKRLTRKATGRQAPSTGTRWGIVLERGVGLEGGEEPGTLRAVADEPEG